MGRICQFWAPGAPLMPGGAPRCHESVRLALRSDDSAGPPAAQLSSHTSTAGWTPEALSTGGSNAASGVRGDSMRAVGRVIGKDDRPGMTSRPVMMKTNTSGLVAG